VLITSTKLSYVDPS